MRPLPTRPASRPREAALAEHEEQALCTPTAWTALGLRFVQDQDPPVTLPSNTLPDAWLSHHYPASHLDGKQRRSRALAPTHQDAIGPRTTHLLPRQGHTMVRPQPVPHVAPRVVQLRLQHRRLLVGGGGGELQPLLLLLLRRLARRSGQRSGVRPDLQAEG